MLAVHRACVAVAAVTLLSSCGTAPHEMGSFGAPDITQAERLATAYPAPLGLHVSNTLFTVVTWRRPASIDALTTAYIYRSTTPSFADARQIGALRGHTAHFDWSARAGVNYWYWVRYEDRAAGVFGALAMTTTASGGADPFAGIIDPTSGEIITAQPEEPAYEVAPASLRPTQSPIILSDRMHVGAIESPDQDALTYTGQRGRARVYSGRTRDGVSSTMLRSYIRSDAQAGRESIVIRFDEQAPIVRVKAGATREMVRQTAHAVQLINAWLPHDWKLGFDALPVNTGKPDYEHEGILVEFSSRTTWPRHGIMSEDKRLGRAVTTFAHYSGGFKKVLRGLAQIDPQHTQDDERVGVIVHEILHTLGRQHASNVLYPDTIMHATPDAVPGFMLHSLDRDALMAIHGKLETGEPLHNLVTDLGDWDDESQHLVGIIEDIDVSFGVATRNGFSHAWANGEVPEQPLSQNPDLSGTVTWDGALLGFTPAGESVAGDAELQIDMLTLRGDLDFTRMRQWPAGQRVRLYGGTLWGDGDLEYGVRVSGNYILRTSGDAGTLTGAFMNNEHHAAGGTLYREGLTAAFGMQRN